MGIAEVIKEHYQDPTTDDAAWVAVDIKPVKTLKNTVSLAQIKSDKRLANIHLVRQGRLSVMPLRKEEFDIIVSMGS
jgi:predicted RNA-binding protein with PUA-like domain